MNIEDFKKLSPQDAFAAAGNIAGIEPSVFDGIWNTESRRGKNMLSPAGAQGHFQIMPKTQEVLARRFGRAIDPNDFHEALFGATELMRENMKRFGNVEDALRAYNGGWNPKTWGNPETAAYPGKVLGKQVLASPEAAAQSQARATAYVKSAPAQDMAATFEAPAANEPWDTRIKSLLGVQQEAEKAYQGSGFIDKARAAFNLGGITSAAYQHLHTPDFPTKDGYHPDPKELVGYTADEIARLNETRSPEEFEWQRAMLGYEKNDQEELGRSGVGVALAASLFASLPEAIITGKALASGLQAVGMGSRAAAAAGKTGKALGLSALENVGGNVAMSGVEQAMGRRVSGTDYAVAAAGGLIGLGLDVPGVTKGAALVAERELGMRVATEAVERRKAFETQAVQNLGETAAPEALAREASRLEADSLVKQQGAHFAPKPDADKLLPDMEKLTKEAEEAAANPQPSAAKNISDALGLMNENMTKSVGDTGILSPRLVADDAGNIGWTGVDKPFATRGWFTPEADREILAHNAKGNGIHQTANFAAGSKWAKDTVAEVQWLADRFLPKDMRISLADQTLDAKGVGPNVQGSAGWLGKDHAVIFLKRDALKSTLVHEVGHLIFERGLRDLPPAKIAEFKAAHAEWLKAYTDAPAVEGVLGRGAISSLYTESTLGKSADRAAGAKGLIPSAMDLFAGLIGRAIKDNAYQNILRKPTEESVRSATKYIPKVEEFGAEQFLKYLEAAAAGELNWKPASIPSGIIDFFKSTWNRLADLFNMAKDKGLLSPDTRVTDFFEAIRKQTKAADTKERRAAQGMNPNRAETAPMPSQANTGPLDVATKYGLNNLPEDTPALAAEKKAMIHLYTKADNPEAPWNNIPADRLNSITTKADWAGSTGLLMLKSDNPVARMVAYELVETTTGAGGRHTTAALSKYLAERKAMGNVINELQDVYAVWRNAQGGSIAGDFMNGKHWEHFNRLVAEEIESRRMGIQTDSHVAISKAADSIEATYDRLRLMQVEGKTPGWGALPETSRGYMPHKMSPAKIANMTRAQSDAIHDALIDQFVTVEGWDISFATNLAGKYVDRVRRRALGGYDTVIGQHSPGAADIVQDALTAMGLTKQEIAAQMKKYQRGAASHTKSRVQLDMLKEYNDAETGSTFTLMDLFDTDHLGMMRGQASRVSGEVALARFGIMGKSGMQLIRQAMDHGFSGQRVRPAERDAFDQVAAEFLGEPFGNHGGKWMNRAIQANSLIRLGGMGFTQTAEYINAAAHLGVGHMLSALGGFSRLRAEAVALAKGAQVSNPILSSIEKMGGAEFGTDSYKMVFPFDNPNMEYQVAGRDTPGTLDRLLRGGMHAQGKLSFWRAVHSAQQRGMAEQIVLKALRYVREGGEDKALADMGFTPEVTAALRSEYSNLVKLDAQGNVVGFDITKMENLDAAEAFIQATHRGVGQIIQGTFIGETGKWAHEGWLKLITQFRTFSLVSVEKQWGRNRANHGMAKALGILMGSMAVAAPIYMARTYAASLGRPDQDAYLERRLAPAQIARATMNYVASSGLAGDFIDALGSVAGYSTTGGRVGNGTGFVGEVVAPAAGLVDDIWKGVQDTDKNGTNIHGLVKNMPMANLPFLIPIVNLLKD